MTTQKSPTTSGSLRRALSASLVMSLLLAGTSTAFAQITNGSFESTPDYTGYTRSGATSIVTSAFGNAVPNGTRQAFLDNDTTNGAVSVATLATFVGVTTTDLNGMGQGTVRNGSAIKQTFNATAGSTIAFTYNFLTAEDPVFDPNPNNDFSFVRISGPGIAGNGLILLRNISSATTPTPFTPQPGPDRSDYLTETGYINFSSVLSSAGVYTLTIGVVNVDDVAPITGDVGSGLQVDNITLTPGQVTVNSPEPTSAILALLGVSVGLGAIARRRRMQ